ncbi:MAG: hypothetical protein JJU00_12645 [Opitutales bacterium]|nr:hypothetical protein [Opitutales bacterium]
MKHGFLLPALSLAVFAAVTGCAVADRPATAGDARETLHVLIDKTRGSLSIDEEYLLTKAIEEVFDGKEYSGDYIVRRAGRGAAPPEAPRLIINIVEWRQTIPNQIDCRLSASLRVNGARHDLGVVRGEQTGLVTALGPDEVNDLFRQAAAKAVRALYPRLAEHLAEAT